MNDKTKLSFTSVYDLMDVLTKGDGANVKLGVALEMKL